MTGPSKRTPNVSTTGPRPSVTSQCPFCDAPVISGMPYCPACGKRLQQAPSGRACGRCGTEAPAETKYCAACGLSLDRRAPGQAAPGEGAQQVAGDSPFKLTMIGEDGSVISEHSLTGAETTIGREGADLLFAEDDFLSPLHAKLTERGGRVFVRDLGSRNGTWVFILEPHKLVDGDMILIGSQLLAFRRLGYPGPHPPERDATRRMGSLVPSADIAKVTQLRSDGSDRDTIYLSPGRSLMLGRERGDWVFPYDPSMSGQHAEIRSEDADFVLVDLESRNGVALAVRGEVEIFERSRVLVGDKLFRLEVS